MAKPELSIYTLPQDGAPTYRIIRFEIPGGITTPAEFAEVAAGVGAQVTGSLPVLINGRGPVWGYAMLVHEAHPSPAIATFDPRLGYVIVQTHDARFKPGDIIPDPEANEGP